MTDRVFVDTNVLIYARDLKANGKRIASLAWLEALADNQSLTVNLQVLNELARWMLKNDSHRPLSAIRHEVDSMKAYGDAAVTVQDTALAWDVRNALGYQWFDCLLMAAASNAGCRYFLSEDMSDRASFRGLTIINPFRCTPADLFLKN
jgi:predicted nucleic acid-binding protein